MTRVVRARRLLLLVVTATVVVAPTTAAVPTPPAPATGGGTHAVADGTHPATGGTHPATGGAHPATGGTLPATDRPDSVPWSVDGPNPCVGTIESRPDSQTLLSIQGARAGEKTVGMVVGIQPDGAVTGIYNGTARGKWWVYDVDVQADGNLLLATTVPGETVIEEIDPTTGDVVESWQLPDVLDAHDVDRIGDGELLLNDKSKGGDDRVLIYDTETERVVWEYRFANHTDQFPKSGGGPFEDDWTHNNDVEQIREGVVMVSVRNFDQVVAIDRETKEILWRLGADDDYDVLNEQHNPDFFVDESGRPTVLVADSENDRVAEYSRADDGWERTWTLSGGGLDEPRDADRLPNGNTLVADRRGHRLLEVTPEGQVVWEVYAPWQPYDAERVGTGDESSRPSMRTVGVTGPQEMTGSANPTTEDLEACYEFLTSVDSRQLLPGQATAVPNTTDTPVPTTAAGVGDGSGGGDGGGAGSDGADNDGDSTGDGGDSTGDDGDGQAGNDGGADDSGDAGGTAVTTPVSFGVVAVTLLVAVVTVAVVVRRR